MRTSTNRPSRSTHPKATLQRRRRYTVRVKSLAVLIATSAFIVGAPISWNRLPNFGLAVIAPKGPNPLDPPNRGRKINPESIPERGTLITPQQRVATSSATSYKFLSPTFDNAVPFISSCRPYRYVIRRTAGPPNGDTLIRGALQRIADVTGITFEWGGFTNELYKFNQSRTYFPFDTPDRELWIGWAFDDEVPDLGPTSNVDSYAVGVGGPQTLTSNGRTEIVGGGVVLRADDTLPNTFGPGRTSGNVLIHELLHAFGLDHADVDGEVMKPAIYDGAPDGLGPGDTAGLQHLNVSCPK